MRRRGGILLFISACIPGCGQMYQGYMKRGVSLLAVGCAVIALASVLSLGELAVFLPLLWLFAFFDTYNLHGQTDEQAENNPDGYLFGLSSMDSERLVSLCRGRHSLIGWCLVALGVYALYSTVVSNLFWWLPDWLYRLMHYDMPRVAVTMLIIALGVWFIRGPRKKETEEDYDAFTPPAEERKTEDRDDGTN